MKKISKALVPLFISALSHNISLISMETTNNASVISFLTELRNNKKFKESAEKNNAQESSFITPNLSRRLTMQSELASTNNELPENKNEKNQTPAVNSILKTKSPEKQRNIIMSQIINDYADTDIKPIPQAVIEPKESGLDMNLYLKSYTYTSLQLILYMLNNQLFKTNNTDHQNILENGVLECIKSEDCDSLTHIVNLIENIYPGTNLENETITTAINTISDQQTKKQATFISSLEKISQEKQIECAAIMKTLINSYKNTEMEITKALNTLNAEDIQKKKEYIQSHHTEKNMLSLLNKISKTKIAISPTIPSWDEKNNISKDIQKSIQTINTDLANKKNRIEYLEQLLISPAENK